jgi:hypothetical protein
MTQGQADTDGSEPRQAPNPLLEAWEGADLGRPDPRLRSRLLTKYSFAIPTAAALEAIAAEAADVGVLEVGAGTGYWAHLLRQHGVDVLATDADPAPSRSSRWFAGSQPWTQLVASDHSIAGNHPDRTLLIVWPTKDEIWAAEALEIYWSAGGHTVIYVGERPGGRTGDDVFHALLGEYDRCWACSLGISTMPCVCGLGPRFERVGHLPLPHWPGFSDDLFVYRRAPGEFQPLSSGVRRVAGRWRLRRAAPAVGTC